MFFGLYYYRAQETYYLAGANQPAHIFPGRSVLFMNTGSSRSFKKLDIPTLVLQGNESIEP